MLSKRLAVRAVACWVTGISILFGSNRGDADEPAQRVNCELLIVGATESGWAAAIQAARMGLTSIAIVHDGEWMGGQFTEQALACVDENKGVGRKGWGVDWHPMKRSFHRSGLFKELMDRIESFNRDRYGDPMPGRPHHGPSTFRPAEAEAQFRALLQPYVDRGQVRLFWNRYPVAVSVNRSGERARLDGVSFAPLDSSQPDLHVTAPITIDASDWGEAIQLSGAEFECGPDPRSRYGEPSAPVDLDDNPPNEMNPITWAMVVEQADEETPIDKPERMDDRCFVRSSKLGLAEMKSLPWDRPVRLGSIPHWPDEGTESPRQLSVYTVRRLVDGNTSKQGKTVILLNYMLGQDYPLERLPRHVCEALEATAVGASQRNLVRMTRPQREIVFADARRHSLCLLYHLQNYVHDRAEDRANSFRSFRLSREFATADHLPPKPYIRESLRLKAMYMMREQDGRNRDGETKDTAIERFSGVMYPDGVMCWQFHYDFHRTGRAYLQDVGDAGPWIDYEKPGRHTHHISDRSVLPLRSLIPEATDGLLERRRTSATAVSFALPSACMTSALRSARRRVAAAAVALQQDLDPRSIPYDRERLEEVRAGLCGPGEGIPLQLWPFRDLPADHDAFVAINRLSAIGVVVANDDEVDFRPDAPAEPEWFQRMSARAEEAVGKRAADRVRFRANAGRSLPVDLESAPNESADTLCQEGCG